MRCDERCGSGLLVVLWVLVAGCRPSAEVAAPADADGLLAAVDRHEALLRAEGYPGVVGGGDAASVAAAPADESASLEAPVAAAPAPVEAEAKVASGSFMRSASDGRARSSPRGRSRGRRPGVCELADAVCDVRSRVCDLAARRSGEPRYADACVRATSQCAWAQGVCLARPG